MWLFRKTHSLARLLYVLVAKIHSSVLNSALIAHPSPPLPSAASSQMATTVVGFSIGTERRKKPWEYIFGSTAIWRKCVKCIPLSCVKFSPYLSYFCRKYCLKNFHHCVCTRVAMIPEVWTLVEQASCSVWLSRFLKKTGHTLRDLIRLRPYQTRVLLSLEMSVYINKYKLAL